MWVILRPLTDTKGFTPPKNARERGFRFVSHQGVPDRGHGIALSLGWLRVGEAQNLRRALMRVLGRACVIRLWRRCRHVRILARRRARVRVRLCPLGTVPRPCVSERPRVRVRTLSMITGLFGIDFRAVR